MSWLLCLLSNSVFIIMTSITTIISPLTLFAQLQEKMEPVIFQPSEEKTGLQWKDSSSHLFSMTSSPLRVAGGAEPISYVCCCLFCERPHKKTTICTFSQFKVFAPYTHIFGFLWEEAAVPTETYRKEPDPGIEPTTFILWGTSANHCTTVSSWTDSFLLFYNILFFNTFSWTEVHV